MARIECGEHGLARKACLEKRNDPNVASEQTGGRNTRCFRRVFLFQNIGMTQFEPGGFNVTHTVRKENDKVGSGVSRLTPSLGLENKEQRTNDTQLAQHIEARELVFSPVYEVPYTTVADQDGGASGLSLGAANNCIGSCL